ncbi:MAG: hypothetical protein KAG61_04750 [Bacteriovoracaceae bacterium]|nr:hypothetical protein [Bacteriovoracaceae bacterium]
MGLGLRKENKINIQLDTGELTAAQVRLIKSLNSTLAHVITTEDESEFFDGSAECIRICASLIKQSYFSTELKDNDNIPYADQAIEYSMDALQESITDSKVVTYDN